MIDHPVLSRLALHGMRLGLDRVEDLLAWLGSPHRAAPVVHVAGTNGKGSVCTMITEALVAAGLRVGTNLSPHLHALNERFLIDGVPLSDAELGAGLDALDARVRAWAAARGLPDDPLTYFELCTVFAFVTFAARAVDVVVLEVGMGGRLDATNVVRPAVCAITGIALDHTEHLGPTLAAIAAEKAGILKHGVPVVVGEVAPEARAAIADVALRVGAPAWWVGEEVEVEAGPPPTIRTPVGSVGPLGLAMPGAHQVRNAAVAVAVLHRLRQAGLDVADAAITLGLARARIAGRVERLAPDLVVDGAHNLQGTLALADWLGSQPRTGERVLLFGVGDERDPVELIAPLLGCVDRVVATHGRHPKARPSAALAALLRAAGVQAADGGPVERALPAARGPGREVVVAGSLYLVGDAREVAR